MPGTAALIVGLVVAIADGDTLTVLNEDFQQVKVRLAEIDAPEKKQAFGTRSRQSLGELCHEKRAEVRVIDVDRYKRIVGPRVRQLRAQVFVFFRAHFQKCHYNSANCSGAAGFSIPKA